MLRWLKRRKRSAASVGILTAAAVALGVMAFTYPGFTTTNVDMHDGGVWVTKNDASLLGHINQQAGELDAGLTVASSDFDVLQYDGDVLLKDNANVALDAVNTGAATLTGQVPIPPRASVSLRGGTVTILDPVDGRLWAMPVSSLAQFSSEETQPLAELGTGSAAVADETGGVHAVSSANGTWQSWQSTAEGFALQTETERPELREATDLTITSVGDKAAALDQAHGVLLLLDARVDVPAGAVLQQPGEASQNVIVATPESLITQPLDGSAAVIDDLAPGTSAVAPVQVDECVYSVSTGDMTLTRACSDPARDLQEVVTDVDAGSIVFREHRGVVALNDVQQGVSWLVSDQLIMVDNWQDLIPPQSEEETEEEDDSSSEDVLDNRTPDDAEENSDPVANDDTLFGARRGLSTLVPVTHNDTDPDGDLLTVSLVDEAPGGVRISPVQNYTQFQVEIPADYGNSSLTFEYEVNDGRGGTDQARVTLQLRDETQNEAPAELREQSFEVEQRATYEHSVLDGWFDPDGDDVYLLNAWSEFGDTVQFAPNGRVNYTATGEVGPTELFVEITDGTEVTEGVIKVMVSERGEGKPLANADYVALGENSRASIRPMANDFIPGGGKAWVASVTSRDGSVQATLDRSTNTVVLESASAGVHFVDYVLGAGPFSAQGTIRVDVLEPVEDAQPVAVRDLALLPVGGEALVDLTENDVDPTGGVLVVQSVMVDGAPVSTKLINRNLLRIEDNRGALEPMTIQYSVSNGSDEATGEINIVPVPPPTKPRPPVGVDDTATLREGDFVSVDVTDNDFSPDGLAFSVSPEIVETSLAGPEEGSVFVDGDKVRVHVLVGGPGAVDVTYEIVDAQGNKGTATLTVAVERRDAESNAPPVPKEVTARVLAGSTIRIPIPLDGIDPDGDGVTLVGYDTNPEQGRIENVGPDYFDYEAFDADGGTTLFQYRVRDRWGAESVSSITVGIAQPGAINQPPVAETDTVTVRPGRSVAVAVLDNDTDPDGDNIVLTAVDAEAADDEIQGLQLSEDGSHVVFTAPESEGEWQVPYSIEDVRGMPQTGTVRIVVSETAPLIAPSAVDDSVEVTDLVEGEPFDVDVLANDRDADGDPAELEVSVVTGPATVSSGQVQVVPSETWQVVTYRVTDIDGGSSEAFVFVPGVGKQPPHLAGNAEVTVPSGELAEIRLIDYVVMPQGGSPRITTTESVSATNANGDELVIDESTLAYTSELGYVGKAAITFEVSDGEGPDDPDALTARLSIPINVIPSSQVKPTFNGLAIQVEPAEDAVEYDLKPHTRDPDEGDVDAMVYSLGDGGGEGVHADVRGQSFIASADADVPAGTTVTYQIMLTDPAGNDVPGTVQVQVVTSTRELAQAVADTAETEQGVEVTIPAIGNDVNPFADRGEPLEIVSVRTVAGDVEGAPSTDGASVSVVPGGDFAGTLTLQYTVQDATKSESRQVTGSISVNVKGRPDAPVRPNVNAIGDSEVTLSWAAPSSNGAPITGYLVEYSGGSQACESTTCTVSGLTNDTTYNFTVRAINEVGESDPSGASIDARPDVKPEQPEAPTAVRGDQKLDVSWE
ncbi:MAG: Ig-like domain-containing protein, partial [Agrococcus casei]|uniref:Ig-like domain-containing protein n=1 Tax=Agrococcus casei TaxID=343512 RepID=UPI003F933C41